MATHNPRIKFIVSNICHSTVGREMTWTFSYMHETSWGQLLCSRIGSAFVLKVLCRRRFFVVGPKNWLMQSCIILSICQDNFKMMKTVSRFQRYILDLWILWRLFNFPAVLKQHKTDRFIIWDPDFKLLERFFLFV